MKTYIKALGRLKVGEMNKTEADYNQQLFLLQAAGHVLWYKFEALKFRLADSTFYTPDFIVMMPDRTIEAHEIKGFWTDDARVKIKVAASQFPMFTFKAFKKIPKKAGGGWSEEVF